MPTEGIHSGKARTQFGTNPSGEFRASPDILVAAVGYLLPSTSIPRNTKACECRATGLWSTLSSNTCFTVESREIVPTFTLAVVMA